LWSPHISPIASPWTKLLFSDPRNLIGGGRYMDIFVCRSGSRCCVVLITNIPLCLLARYMRMASIIGYGTILWHGKYMVYFREVG
jgi:hypothetical protein